MNHNVLSLTLFLVPTYDSISQVDRQTDRQIDRQTDRLTDWKKDRLTAGWNKDAKFNVSMRTKWHLLGIKLFTMTSTALKQINEKIYLFSFYPNQDLSQFTLFFEFNFQQHPGARSGNRGVGSKNERLNSYGSRGKSLQAVNWNTLTIVQWQKHNGVFLEQKNLLITNLKKKTCFDLLPVRA